MSLIFKLIFVFASLCIVNSSVITVNVFDDDPDTEVQNTREFLGSEEDSVPGSVTTPSNIEDSHSLVRRDQRLNGKCYQGCLRVGFSPYICYCVFCGKCFKSADHRIDNANALTESAESYSSRSCNNNECIRNCVKKGYISGKCVLGRCRCQLTPLEDEVNENTDTYSYTNNLETDVSLSSSKKCNFRECIKKCNERGYYTGSCATGSCICREFLLQDAADETDAENSVSGRSCNAWECEQRCRRDPGFLPGRCIKGRCKCGHFFRTEDEVTKKSENQPETVFTVSERSCNLWVCEQLCRRQGFTSGVCVNGRCKCDKVFRTNDDDIEAKLADSFSERSCDNRECDQRCRRLKFPGGVCVNGFCKCDNFVATEDAVNKAAVADYVSERSCNNRECHQRCRRLQFLGGICVNGRCKCDNFLRTNDEVTDISEPHPKSAESVSERSCNLRACEQQCRRLGFTGGVCVNGRCKCDNFLQNEDKVTDISEPHPKSAESVSERSCNLRACEQQCRRLGFPGGVCVNGRCKCDNFFRNEDKVTDISEPHPKSAESVSERSCNLRACEQQCRRLGFPGGVCVNSRCKCDNFLRNEDEVTDISEPHPKLAESVSERSCNLRACEQQCRRLGFPGGVCVNGRCKCDNFLRNEDKVTDISEPHPKSAEYVSERSCNLRACEQQCRRLGFTGGVCVNGRCKCDNFLRNEDDVTDTSEPHPKSAESVSERSCNLRACEQQCRRLGFPGGVCVNGRCKCDNFLRNEESMSDDETTGTNDAVADAEVVENEEFSLIVKTDEDELTVPSLRACDTVKCNQMCHRLNFAGGWCRQGRCECY